MKGRGKGKGLPGMCKLRNANCLNFTCQGCSLPSNAAVATVPYLLCSISLEHPCLLQCNSWNFPVNAVGTRCFIYNHGQLICCFNLFLSASPIHSSNCVSVADWHSVFSNRTGCLWRSRRVWGKCGCGCDCWAFCRPWRERGRCCDAGVRCELTCVVVPSLSGMSTAGETEEGLCFGGTLLFAFSPKWPQKEGRGSVSRLCVQWGGSRDVCLNWAALFESAQPCGTI